METPKIEWAEHDRVDELEEIASQFFAAILGMDRSEILITDDSALWDFQGCGEDCEDFPLDWTHDSLLDEEYGQRWDEWVTKKIEAKYGIAAPDKDRLFRLFLQIKSAQNQRGH